MKSSGKAPTPEREGSVLQVKKKAKGLALYKKNTKKFMANYVMRVELHQEFQRKRDILAR